MSGRAPRVLLDATAVPADRGGVGRYVDGLISALAAAGARARGRLPAVGRRAVPPAGTAAEVVPGPSAISHRPARLAWEQTGLPLVAQQVGADVIHSPYYTMPLHARVPVVVTVHDVTFFSEPELHSALKAGFYRSATRTAVRRATRVVVPSQATRDELVRLLDADADRIDVARHGVDTAIFHVPTVEASAGGSGAARPARPAVRRVPRRARAAQERADLVRGWVKAVRGPA